MPTGSGDVDETPNPPADRSETVDLDPGAAMETLDTWLDGTVRLLLHVAVAVVPIVSVVASCLAAKLTDTRPNRLKPRRSVYSAPVALFLLIEP